MKKHTLIIIVFLVLVTSGFFSNMASASELGAAETAAAFLESMPFSRAALIEQLVFAGYTPEESEHAVDSLNVDWNEMAVKSARSYLEASDYSEKGLINLLESSSEGYTHEQAVHGVSVAAEGVDWNEMAARRAAFYLKSSAFSEKGLIKQLESDRVAFTHEQAVYGAKAAGADVDWNEMAVKRARVILENSSISENGLIRQLESDTLGYTHEQALYAANVVGQEVDWFEMAVQKAKSYLQVTTYKRSELIELLESDAEGFTHEQAVYAADNSNASWGDMITVLAANLDNIYPIHGLEDSFTNFEPALYSDIGADTSIETSTQYGVRNISLFSNPDRVHDRSYLVRLNSGRLDNFLFSMDITINDTYPDEQAGCFIGYLNELKAAQGLEEMKQVFLMVDRLGVGFYNKYEHEDSGSLTRILTSNNQKYTLSLIRFTGQTYAFVDGSFAGQFKDENEGPFQLVYGVSTLKDGDTAACSFDNMSVRKVNN